MKKVFLGLGVIALIGVTSCKKSRICECTSNSGGSVYYSNVAVYGTKKNAKEICDDLPSTSQPGTKCSLKD